MAPLLVGDVVYIGSTNGSFYAFNKVSLEQAWSGPYNAGSALIASPAYSTNHNGLIILLSETTDDNSVHTIQANDGSLRWQITVNDLTKGRTVKCRDIIEVLEVEKDVRAAAEIFADILRAASWFGGEEIVEL